MFNPELDHQKGRTLGNHRLDIEFVVQSLVHTYQVEFEFGRLDTFSRVIMHMLSIDAFRCYS